MIDGFIFNGFANKFGGLCGNAFQLTAENVTVKNVNATFCEKAECAANTASTSDILAGMFAFGNSNHFTNCAVINITFDVRYKTQTNRFVAVGGFAGILQDAGAYPTNERNGFYENCTTKGSMNTGDASDVKVGTFVGAMKKPAPGVTVKGCTAQSTWDGGKEAPYIEKAESGEKESTPYAVLAYDANGFFTTNMPQMVIVECEGESVTLIISDETMVRDGYTFQGWNTSADGTGTSYKADDEITVYKPGETLYAQWKADPTPGHGNRPTHHDSTAAGTDGNVTSAKTFDAGIALHVGMSVLSLTGSAVVVTKKKRG